MNALAARLPRARGRVAWQAAAALWLPTLLPLLVGMLRDCGHCVGSYLTMAPVVPGVIVPTLLHLQGAWFFVVAALPTCGLFGVLYVTGREAEHRLRWGITLLVALAVAAQAIGFACALRA